MIRRALPFLVLSLIIAPAQADAAVSQKKAIWGPVEIEGESQFPVYKDLGAGIYQTLLEWDKVAVVAPEQGRDPEDIAYDWPAELDTAIDEGKRNGIAVALTVTGTPGWANGERQASVAPTKPADLADFLAAAAKRYPGVHLWGIWDGKVSPAARYPQMLDAAYAALHSANKRNRVIGGNGNARLKLANGKAARMDMLGTDPSGRKAPTKARLAALKKQAGAHKLWLGPVSLPTSEGAAFRLTKAAQASWLKSAFKLVKADAKIAALSYRSLIDEPGSPFRGLLEADGTKKPAYNAFKRA